MDAFLFLVLVGLAFLSAAAPIAWSLVAGASTKAGHPSGAAAVSRQADLDRLVAQLTRQLGGYSNLPINKRAGRRAHELASNAANAGIDWNAPSY